jgi:hypothetical protein
MPVLGSIFGTGVSIAGAQVILWIQYRDAGRNAGSERQIRQLA